MFHFSIRRCTAQRRYLRPLAGLLLALTLMGTAALPSSSVRLHAAFAPVDVTDYPTVAALHASVIPPRDRVDLARRFRGVGDIPPPPAAASVPRLGVVRLFWATNASANRQFQVSAELLGISEHALVWVEQGSRIEAGSPQRLAEHFDTYIYDAVRELWGSEATPGIDGEPRVVILFAHNLGSGTAGYFASEHTYPAEVVPNSNEAEMFFINLDVVGTALDDLYIESILAHEFQHMIRANVDGNEDTWMDEGFSTFTALALGYPGSDSFAWEYLAYPGDQLNAWTENGARGADYGAALLLLTYFYERYGLHGVQLLSADPANGLAALDNTLAALGEPDANTFFADWTLANALMDPRLADGRYGYTLLSSSTGALPYPLPLPYAGMLQPLNQYAAAYYHLLPPMNTTALDIQLSVPQTVALLPVEAASGRQMWYSNRGDQSDTTLTRAFDLRGVSAATLEYSVWHHLEQWWDYGYVLVSTDDGATWTALESAHTTRDNPHGTAYGPGYTGESGGWQRESVSLDAYAGQEILLRFEVITDDAINQPGMAVDAVAIPELGYSSDFEQGADGWTAAGWILTDNVLPQLVWVQAVQRTPGGVELTRWLAHGDAVWTLDLLPGSSEVLLILAPFAPVTMVPAPLNLSVIPR